jgi:hypothetical protein
MLNGMTNGEATARVLFGSAASHFGIVGLVGIAAVHFSYYHRIRFPLLRPGLRRVE